jgi:hypothetical protein
MPRMSSPFHPGEQAVQTRAGVRAQIEAVGRRVVRDAMPDQHRQFFATQPWLLVGSLDADGHPHASVLWGAPGFAHAPDPTHLRVDALPEPDDPLAAQLAPGAPLGLLGLELPTRRRNRMNGPVVDLDARGFTVAVRQSFGNCPKYIQTRAWRPHPRAPGPAAHGDAPDDRAHALLAAADTFFLASHDPDPDAGGVDVSHRGGPPGFLRRGADGRLWLPDYAGNFMFNTLGNLHRDPRCGLLVVDFATGDLLQLAAVAEVLWPDRWSELDVPPPAGAERMLALTPGAWRLRPARLPLAFGDPSPSPFLP